MKKYKKIALFIVILFIIIVSTLIVIIQKKVKEQNVEVEKNLVYSNTVKNAFYPVDDFTEYFKVKSILDRVITNIKTINGDNYINEEFLRISKEEAIKQQKKETMNFFENVIDKEYKNQYSISEEKLVQQFNRFLKNGEYSKSDSVYITNIKGMYECQYTSNITLFLVYSIIDEEELDLLIKYDNYNKTYSLFLSDFIEDNHYNINMEYNNINIYKENIEENIYTKIIINKITDEEMSKEYFAIQKNNLLYNLKYEYSKLNDEYKNKKYNNYSNFENYYSGIKSEIYNSKLEKYNKECFNNKDIFTLIDNKGRYYIIEKKDGLFNYDVYLDNYTIDTEKFKDIYNKSNGQEKVILNIGKVISAINNDDFKYFYNKLADSFKNNYFENEDALKNYWLDNLYKKNKVEFMDFNREGNLYTYKLKITKQYEEGEESTFGKDAPSSFINIVMQLKEGTDFVMSFSVLEQ